VKLNHRGHAGTKLALSGGHVATVDADGNVEVEKKEHVDALTSIGFTASFARKGKEKAEPVDAGDAPTKPEADPVDEDAEEGDDDEEEEETADEADGEEEADDDAEDDEPAAAAAPAKPAAKVKGKTAGRGRARR